VFNINIENIMETIEIKKGIPVVSGSKKTRGSKYPFEKMEVGDSFDVSWSKNKVASISQAMRTFRKNNPTWKFKISSFIDEDIVRCWRLE